MAIGDRPGPDEYKRSGRPFTGKSGQELNENYLYLAGLTRDDIYFCNTVRCGSDGNRPAGKQETEACARHFLPYELDAVKPHFILLMGGTACSLFDDTDPIHLAMDHGRPLRRKLFGREYWVVPMYHPALGMRDTRQMTPILEDWETLKLIVNGDFRIPKDPYAGKTDYRLVDAAGLQEYLFTQSDLNNAAHTGYTLYGGLDTETDAGKMWCITISVKPGTGVMIKADDVDSIELLKLYQKFYHWFIHNASFDIEVLGQAAYPIQLNHYSCTQQAVYHRGNLAQGLKVLGYRLFGIKMTSYEDTVLPWSRRKLMDWWVDALINSGMEQVEIPGKVSLKTGRQGKSKFKSTKFYSRLLYIYNHAQVSEDYDPWKKWDEMDEDYSADKKRLLGEMDAPPRQSIIHVPTQLAVNYATLDADVGLRLGLHLRKDERLFRKRAGFKR